MLIKNFQAPTIQDALDLVRREFGAEAVILKTDVLRENGRRYFTVTAAKDAVTGTTIAKAAARKPEISTPAIAGGRVAEPGLESALLDVVLPDLLKGEVRNFYLALRLHDVEADLALDICRRLQRAENTSRESLLRILSAIMPAAIDIPAEAANIVFVGPCGSGKSSLLAKYATHFVFQRKERVTLQTLDNFRPGAEDEINNLADILELAVEPRGNNHQKTPRQLIDTTGIVCGDRETFDQLAEQLNQMPERFTIAVLSLTNSWRDNRRFLEFAQSLEIDAVAFTQLDAAESCGALLNLVVGNYPPLLCLSESRLPTALIAQFEIERLADKLIGAACD